MRFSVCVVVLWLAAGTGLGAQGVTSSKIDFNTVHLSRIVTAVRVNEKITLDGRLEEPAWSLAVPAAAADFLQSEPHEGEPATEKTEARILYDEDNLYLGATCFDSDMAHATANELREDYTFRENDGIVFLIDGVPGRRAGFQFGVNIAGGKRDVQMFNALANQDWDGVWDAKVARFDGGWSAEFVIPFKTLRFSESANQEWAFNVVRKIVRTNEEIHWSVVQQRLSAGRMDLAGTLKGLNNVGQGRNLKVKPFIAANMTQTRQSNGRLDTIQSLGRIKDYDGGVDLKYGVTPSLTFDATYRTDFAQVEADQQQVNLTRFNLFFPEKREFFLENANMFDFGTAGNSANLVPFFSRRIGLSATGTPIPIVGGGRLSGTAGAYNLGLLAIRTEESDSVPANNFLVGRVRRNLLKNSWVGTLITNRDSTADGDYNRVYGSDAHFQFYTKFEFDAFLLKSDTPGRAGQNQARRVQSAWKDSEFVIGGEFNEVQRNFIPDVGFVRRRDVTQYAGDLAWKPRFEKSETVRSLNFALATEYYEGSSSRKMETRSEDVTMGILFQNNGFANFTINHTFDRLADTLRIPSGNPRVSIARGDYNDRRYTAAINTGSANKYNGTANFSWGSFYGGDRKTYAGTLNLRPNYHLSLNLSYDRNQVVLPGGSFTTDLLGARFIYAFTPRAFFNAFIQYNADTHQVSSNLRFNWTHHPLSDLYLVYNDTRDTVTGQIRERAFIIKLTNLFSF